MSSALRDELVEAIKELSDKELKGLKRAVDSLKRGRDPVAMALAQAPIDDEPTTEEDLAAIAEARDELARGEHYSHEEVIQELGL